MREPRKEQTNFTSKESPSVGIFWLFRGKLIINATPVTQAEDYGDNKTHARSHIDYWTLLQRQGVVPAETEYEEPPRGRVTFNTKTERFTLYADRCILCSEDAVKKLVRKMHLPANTTTNTDLHYRCSRCLSRSR
jgi:hypothetical protein